MANERNVKIKISVDGKEAVTEVSRLKNGFDTLDASTTRSGTAMRDAFGSTTQAQLKQIAASVNDVQNRVNSLDFANVVQQFKNIGENTRGIGTYLTQTLTEPILAIEKLGVKFNSFKEDAITTFTVFLKDGEKAKKLFDDLSDFADSTPFSSTDVVSAGTTLLQAKIDDLKGVLRDAGDLAAANKSKGVSLADTSNAFARVQAGDFGEAFERFRDFGVSRKQLEGEGLKFDKGGQYLGSVEQAMSALRGIVQKNFAGLTEQVSANFSGQLSTLSDTIDRFGGDLSEPVFDTLKNGLKAALPIVTDLKNAFSALSPETKQTIAIILTIVAAIGPLVFYFGTFITAIAGVVEAFGILAPVVAGLVGIFGTVGSAILGIGGTISTLLTLITAAGGVVPLAMAAFTAAIPVIGAALGAAASAIVGFIAIAGGVIAVVAAIAAVAVGLYLAWTTNFGGIRDVTISVFNSVKSTTLQALDYLNNIGGAGVENLVAFWTANYPKVLQVVQTVSDGVQSALATFFGFANAFWKAHGEQITSVANAAYKIVTGYIENFVANAKNVFTLFNQIVNGDWNGAWETFLTIVYTQIKLVFQLFTDLNEFVKKAINVFGPILGDAAIYAFGFLIKAAAYAVVQTVYFFAVTLPKAIVDNIPAIIGAALQVGGAIIRGIRDGLFGGEAKAAIGGSIMQGLTDGAGSTSPKLTDYFGKLVEGAKSYLPDFTKASDKAGESAKKTGAALSGAGGGASKSKSEFEQLTETLKKVNAEIRQLQNPGSPTGQLRFQIEDANALKSSLENLIKLRRELGQNVSDNLDNRSLESIKTEVTSLERVKKLRDDVLNQSKEQQTAEDKLLVTRLTANAAVASAQTRADQSYFDSIKTRKELEQQLSADIATEIRRRESLSLSAAKSVEQAQAEAYKEFLSEKSGRQFDNQKATARLALALGATFEENGLIKLGEQIAANKPSVSPVVEKLNTSNVLLAEIRTALKSNFQSGSENNSSQQDSNSYSSRNSKGAALIKASKILGINPAFLGGIIGFETGGTFDPNKRGGAGGNYRGLIQFGAPERKQFGVTVGQTFEEQVLGPVVKYFQARFKVAGRSTQGASLEDLYTTVIAGNPGANRNKRDSFGTSARSGAARIAKEFLPIVQSRFLAIQNVNDSSKVLPRENLKVEKVRATAKASQYIDPLIKAGAELDDLQAKVNAFNGKKIIEEFSKITNEAQLKRLVNFGSSLESGEQLDALKQKVFELSPAFDGGITDLQRFDLQVAEFKRDTPTSFELAKNKIAEMRAELEKVANADYARKLRENAKSVSDSLTNSANDYTRQITDLQRNAELPSGQSASPLDAFVRDFEKLKELGLESGSLEEIRKLLLAPNEINEAQIQNLLTAILAYSDLDPERINEIAAGFVAAAKGAKDLTAEQLKQKNLESTKSLSEGLQSQIENLQRNGRELSIYEQTVRDLDKSYKDLEPSQREQILILAEQADAQKLLNEAQAKVKSFVGDSLKTLSESGFKGLFKSIKDRFKQMLLDMATEFLTSKIFGLLNGKSGNSSQSSGGGFGSILGGLLGGFGGGNGSNGNGGGLLSGLGSIIGFNGQRVNVGNNFSGGGGFGFSGDGLSANAGGISTVRDRIFAAQTRPRTVPGGGDGRTASGLGGTLSGVGSLLSLGGSAIGGRVGGLLSGAGMGLAIGAQIGSIIPGIGTVIGAGVGAAVGFFASLFGGDKNKKMDKKENLPKLQSGFGDALTQLRDLLTQTQTLRANPDDVISKASEIRASIASGFGIQFKSKKYRKESQNLIAQKLGEADSIIAQIKTAADLARTANANKERLSPEFAGGTYASAEFIRRNGKLYGGVSGKDSLPSMLMPGEMVLNERQQTMIRRNSGFDVFKTAEIPNYATGTFVAPTVKPVIASPVFAQSGGDNNSINSINKSQPINIVINIERDENGDFIANLESENGKDAVIKIINKSSKDERLKIKKSNLY